MLTLPHEYLITPDCDATETKAFLQDLEHCLQSGIRLLQLRQTTLTAQSALQLAVQVIVLAHSYQARVLLHSAYASADDVERLDADGLHYSSSQLLRQSRRPLICCNKLISAACHDAKQVAHATRIGVDLMTISAVAPTQTHPEAVPLGWKGFATLADSTALPVYALGGMQRQSVATAREHGGQGIAAIRGLWCFL